MPHLRTLRFASWAALVAVASFAPSALAQDRSPDRPYSADAESDLGAGLDLPEDAWDIPGQIVVDARDDRDASPIAALASRFGLTFQPTGLEPNTRIEIASVAESSMADVLSWLS